MSFQHEAVAAWMNPSGPDPDLLRAMDTRRFAYCLAPTEIASDFVAADPVSGIIPLNLIQNSTIYAYDETDAITAPSATCLVTHDNKRYKSGVINPPDSVLTYSTVAQPADEDVATGDRFLIPTAATGPDFAGKAGQIGMRVGAKWHFTINPIGRRLYVEDEDRFYYRNDAGVWTAGNGVLAYADHSIPITAVIGTKASFQIKVENQTTNAPPASPVAPVAYIIGPSPTGAWAGKAGQLAICLTDGTFTIIVPTTGDQVWDKSTNNKYDFNGTAWVSAVGAYVGFACSALTQSGSTTVRSTSGYTYSPGTAPTTSQWRRTDDVAVAYAAKRSSSEPNPTLEISWKADVSYSITGTPDFPVSWALYRATGGSVEANAIAWGVCDQPMPGDAITNRSISVTTLVPAIDASLHTYFFAITNQGPNGGNNIQVDAFTRRRTTIKELA